MPSVWIENCELFSVKKFHKNLQSVSRGKWWIYEETNNHVNQEANLDEQAEQLYCFKLAELMCYSYIDDMGPDERVLLNAFALQLQQFYGVAMPAPIFTNFCYRQFCTSPTEEFRARRDNIQNSTRNFITCYHK